MQVMSAIRGAGRGWPGPRAAGSWAIAAGETRLDEFADLARRVIALIDGFSQPMISALDAVGWNSGKTFALRAELTRVVECAERARLGAARR
jgi:hypothetical protein